MMELKYTPKAKEDLQNVKYSVLDHCGSEEIAVKVLREITKTVRNLAVFPYMGTGLVKITGVLTDYRSLFCRHNYIFYRIEGNCILIIRILNEKQDYMRNLFGIKETEE